MPKQRKSKNKKVKAKFQIYCEGEKSELYYLKDYINEYFPVHRNVIVTRKNKHSDPGLLIEAAIDEKKQSNPDDIFWVVYDREHIKDRSHQNHIKWQSKAKKGGIEVAFSNVCFEYWLLLHFEYHLGDYSCYDDLLRRSPLKTWLAQNGVRDYDKGLANLFDVVSKNKGVAKAFEYSARLRAKMRGDAELGKEAPCYLNPYVDVDEMLIDMKNFIDGKPSIRKSA